MNYDVIHKKVGPTQKKDNEIGRRGDRVIGIRRRGDMKTLRYGDAGTGGVKNFRVRNWSAELKTKGLIDP